MCEKRNEKINLSQGKNIFVGACVRSSVRSSVCSRLKHFPLAGNCFFVRAFARTLERSCVRAFEQKHIFIFYFKLLSNGGSDGLFLVRSRFDGMGF
jgi:hypothetical protein